MVNERDSGENIRAYQTVTHAHDQIECIYTKKKKKTLALLQFGISTKNEQYHKICYEENWFGSEPIKPLFEHQVKQSNI